MPFFIFVKIHEFFAKYCISEIAQLLLLYTYFRKNFRKKQIFSQKQIFSRASARISCHLNIFIKMVPLFQMLLTSFAFFLRKLEKVNFLNFRLVLHIIASKVLWKCENVNFRFHPIFEGLRCLYLASHCPYKPTCEYFHTWI